MLYVNLFALLLTQKLLASIESAVIPLLDNVTRNSSGVGMSFEEEMVDTNETSLGYGYNDSVMMLPWPETISVNGYYNESQTQAEKQLFHPLTNETESLTTSSSEEVLSESAYETTNNGTDDGDSLVNEEDQKEQLTEVTELQSSLTRNISVSEDSSYESSTNSAQNQTEHLTTSLEEKRLSEPAYETKDHGSDDGIAQLKENQTGNLNASSEEKDSTESANLTATNCTGTEISLVTETDQSHADMEPEVSSVIEIFGQLLLKLGQNSTNTQTHGYVTALRNPEGSLYIPHQQQQSKEKHLETLLGFAEEIWKGKGEKATEQYVKYRETAPVGDTTMPSSTTSSHPTTDNWNDVFNFDKEEGKTDANMTFTVDLEAENVALGPMQGVSNEPNESLANHTLGRHSKMNESTEESNLFIKETDHAVNVPDSSEIDVSNFSTATQDSLPTDDDQNLGHFSQLSSQLTLIHEQFFNHTNEIMQYFTDIVDKVVGELNHTLSNPMPSS